MALTITDRVMRSPDTKHTAHRQLTASWTVTWLPDRALTRDQAITAMTIAEWVGRIPADAGPEAYDEKFWLFVDGWAAELGLSGPDAVARASEPPAEPPVIRVRPNCPTCGAGASDVTWTGADEPDVRQPADAWQCSLCGTEWETDLRPKP